MMAFVVLIFLFLGSVEGFSISIQPCTYDPTKLCTLTLATVIFNTTSFLLAAFTLMAFGFLRMEIVTYANAGDILEASKGVRMEN